MSEKKSHRVALVLQSGIATTVATAVLLGGFGAFSLWNDSLASGAGTDIATGTLTLDSVTPGAWTIEQSDGVLAPGTAIDPASFKASPGDVLQYTASVQVTADGSDLLAELNVDPGSYAVATELASDVTVTLTKADGTSPDGIPITGADGTRNIDVKVTVAFNDTISGLTGQGLASAVSLSGLNFELNQVTTP